MPADDGTSRRLVDTTVDLPDDRYVEVVVWSVPSSPDYPEGIKYRMQYGDGDETILRYDNAPHHDGARHHRHRAETLEAVDFPGWETLFERFRAKVQQHERDRFD